MLPAMRIDAFEYDFAKESVAQHPPPERDAAKLLVLPAKGAIAHRGVRDLPSLLPRGALMVLNDTRVLPARLVGHKADSGGTAEIFLLKRLDGGERPDVQRWQAMGRASKGLSDGCVVVCEGLAALVLARPRDADGLLEVELRVEEGSLEEALARAGHTPLPPYIRRVDEPADRDRYQTVYAHAPGAVAAPTAGLHFTHDLLERLKSAGHPIATLTLHVGLGTFQPVVVADLDQHAMHEESFLVPEDAARAIAQARRESRAVVAVGTTVVRALESAADPEHPGLVLPTEATTRLLIQPGFRFRVVDGLLTNFHVPRSTLLALVCAFGGTQRVLAAYATAQENGYRFFSYGDAMLLEREAP
jgi:S-adenosylmethionine:tRNA ribosyltransferase-isomerase